MPTYTGKNAVVTVSIDGGTATRVMKLTKIEYNGTKEFTSDSYMGEEGSESAPNSTSFEGSITYHHDTTDAGQAILQQSFDEDKTVDVVIHPKGSNSGEPSVSFTAYVENDNNNIELENKVEKSSGLKINGGINRGVIA